MAHLWLIADSAVAGRGKAGGYGTKRGHGRTGVYCHTYQVIRYFSVFLVGNFRYIGWIKFVLGFETLGRES
jgi:hypothetical protein